jgi:cytochrome c oxidase subunit 1
VVAGTTLAFMGATYLVLPLVFEREILFPKLAQLQPYLFGIGAAGISLFMMGAGTLGVARRHWDMTFSDANLGFAHSAGAFLMIRTVSARSWRRRVASLRRRCGRHRFLRRADQVGPQVDLPAALAGAAATSHYGSEATMKLPGTIILVTIFFVSFVLYYFINWKYSSLALPLNPAELNEEGYMRDVVRTAVTAEAAIRVRRAATAGMAAASGPPVAVQILGLTWRSSARRERPARSTTTTKGISTA